MMTDKRSLNRRESANDLPSVKELRRNAFGLGIIGTLFGIDGARMAALEVRNDLADLCGIVDGFYHLLGDKNWVFSNALNLERMRAVVSGLTPEDAERALVEYLKEEGVLHQMIIRLNRFPDMRPRISLLEKAERDYLDGRYYSSVLVTVSVMDGFVNDVSKLEGRRGFTRKSLKSFMSQIALRQCGKGFLLSRRCSPSPFMQGLMSQCSMFIATESCME